MHAEQRLGVLGRGRGSEFLNLRDGMSMTSFRQQRSLHSRHFRLDSDAIVAPVPASVRAKPDIQRFIDAHRQHGHRRAALDPLGVASPAEGFSLQPERFGLAGAQAVTPDGSALLGARDVRELDQRLKAIYCGPLALDCSGVRDEVRSAWLFARMESAVLPSPRGGSELLDSLIRVHAWEQYVAERFPESKRFSLEGCETLVPLLDALFEAAAGHGIGDVFLGTPHRGRVNVLVNALGMSAADVLDYFDPQSPHPERHRDLIYHLGGRHAVTTRQGEISVTLAHNPSHLQSVYPVVMGMTRAGQAQQASSPGAANAMAIVLHGDAAFAGQGVVMETLVLTQRPGYSVGGAVHVIINNQVGFTEPNPMDAQMARYCTDVTRVIDAPVLRINADAPEHVQRAAEIALEYRMKFGADVVIDLIGFRRLGHSEHDVPMLTAPHLAAMAEHKPTVVEVYGAALASAGAATDAEMTAYIAAGRTAAREAFARDAVRAHASSRPAQAAAPPVSSLSRHRLQAMVSAMTRLPEGFQPHPYIEALIRRWRAMADDEGARADWCFAENVAYASTLDTGIDVRVSGLDVRRGTFFHRHAVWHNQATSGAGSDEFIPLHQLGTGAARFDIVNSVLSEEAVLGFEYGYSVQDRRGLTIWEAQFGDFVNGAQVFVDQYISAGEEKWDYRSALALLLPHGYEGVGPEHSNAYLSRFLALCGADNMRVACPSTSAQWFHLLRRQAFSDVRKPLIVMTPKTTLYSEPASHSPVRQLLEGEFQPVLDDAEVAAPSGVTRVVLCSGKLYYDLQRARLAGTCIHVALLRLEQFYPFPQAALARVLERYPRLQTLVWAQEETRNQGAWAFVRDELEALCPSSARLQEVSRPVTASGATASHIVHRREQQELVARALGRSAG